MTFANAKERTVNFNPEALCAGAAAGVQKVFGLAENELARVELGAVGGEKQRRDVGRYYSRLLKTF